MFVFIVILLVLAAAFGVLGAVLKAALVLLLASTIAIATLAWLAWFWFKRRVRAFELEVARAQEEQERRRRAIEIRRVPNEAEGERTPVGELPARDQP